MTATAIPPNPLHRDRRPPFWEIGLRLAVLAVSLARLNKASGGAAAAEEIDRVQEKDRGRNAATPGQIPMRGWMDIVWRIYAEIGNDRILAVAAGVTFYALLAIFPAIAAFVSVYGLLADRASVGEDVQSLAGVLPGGAIDIISGQVDRITAQHQGALGFAFMFSLAIALWSATSGVKAMIDALNVAYDEQEKRGFVMLTLVSLCFTLGAIAFLVVAMTSVVVIPVVLNFVGLGAFTEILIRTARWPALFAVLVFALALLYRYGPSRRPAKWRWVTWGSVIAAVLWLAASILFSWYVANFGSYNETYGSLGAVVGMMTWIWISVSVVLLGAEINAEIEHQTARDSTVGSPKPIGTRGAFMADDVGPAQVR